MQSARQQTSLVAWAWLPALVLASSAAVGQLPAPVDQLVRKTIQNEIQPDDGGPKYMFRDRKQTPHGSQTKLMVETRDAMVGLLIAINDHPLTPEQQSAEKARVERFVKDPAELSKKQKQEKEDSERINRIMKALPDAFVYEYDGHEMGRPGMGKPGVELVRLKFHPNPKYDPPSRVEQVLTAMQGYVLIDPVEYRISKIDGTLQHDVGFGWGILGHLDRGGRFLVEQGDVGDQHWEISRMDLSFTGKILLFKSISIQSTEIESDFRRVPSDLTFAQGLELLQKQEAQLAENEPQKQAQGKR